MAVDSYLQIDGITGETTAKGMDGYMSINSFQMGASNPATVGPGSGGLTGGRSSLSEFVVTKSTESASTDLFLHCCNGEHYASANVVLRKATGKGGQQTFLKYTFEDILISSISWSGGGDEPSESLSIAFAKITIEYFKQGDDGSMTPSGNCTWDQTAVSD